MVAAVKVRNAYGRVRMPTVVVGDTMTKQGFAKECDINNIMKRYEKDGIISHVAKYGGQYGDFTDVPDYREALDKVMSANEMFMSLPASIRSKFENDPAKFLTFVGDPANKDEMGKLGLLRAPVPGVAVPEPVPASKSGDDKSKS